jgi:hypothetical protein
MRIPLGAKVVGVALAAVIAGVVGNCGEFVTV